jgi:hypothetical protein
MMHQSGTSCGQRSSIPAAAWLRTLRIQILKVVTGGPVVANRCLALLSKIPRVQEILI